VPVVVRLPIHGNLVADPGTTVTSSAVRRPELARHVPTGWGVVCYDREKKRIVPHKRLWRLTDGDGAEIACELETLTTNRVLLVVKKNGAPIVTETFADKRDALARSVGIYKEMKPAAGS
jgi:hypothetical protein